MVSTCYFQSGKSQLKPSSICPQRITACIMVAPIAFSLLLLISRNCCSMAGTVGCRIMSVSLWWLETEQDNCIDKSQILTKNSSGQKKAWFCVLDPLANTIFMDARAGKQHQSSGCGNIARGKGCTPVATRPVDSHQSPQRSTKCCSYT